MLMNNKISISVIGNVSSPLTQKFGIPRQPNLVDVAAEIKLHAPYCDPSSVKGLSAFSHIWVIWQFHAVATDAEFRALIRPPRLGGNEKIGVFASRSMFRPNRMGMSVVQLESVRVHEGKARLHVLGADMLDGTPVLDIKPYIAYSDSIPHACSGYAIAPPQPKNIRWDTQAHEKWCDLVTEGIVSNDEQTTVSQLIAQDPRPAYRQAVKASAVHEKQYHMRYRDVDVVFYADEDGLVICDIVRLVSANT